MLLKLTFLLMSISSLSMPATAEDLSKSYIKQRLIDKSLSRYKDMCPCPYTKVKNSLFKCGEKSLYNSPKKPQFLYCYQTDVPDSKVQKYREYELKKTKLSGGYR
jgi:hypothetical protein